MNGSEEQEILCLLAKRYDVSINGFSSPEEISRDCGYDVAHVKQCCFHLEEDGLIIANGRDENYKSYQIALDGLISLETNSNSEFSKSDGGFLKFKNRFTQKSNKTQMIDHKLQDGLIKTGREYNLVNGLYYIVLIDLSGSTISASNMSGDAYFTWIKKFIQITKKALDTAKQNNGIHIKSMGDGSLFLFRKLNDVLTWKNTVTELCEHHNHHVKKWKMPDFHQYHYKLIIHLGEVYFDSEDDLDVNALAVNMVFKIEKKFEKNEIGITESVRQILLQDICRGKFKLFSAGNFSLCETTDSATPLWKLIIVEHVYS